MQSIRICKTFEKLTLSIEGIVASDQFSKSRPFTHSLQQSQFFNRSNSGNLGLKNSRSRLLQASDRVIQSRRKNDLSNMFPRCKMCTNCAGHKLVQCPKFLNNQSSPHIDEGQMWGIPDLSIIYKWKITHKKKIHLKIVSQRVFILSQLHIKCDEQLE